MQSLNMFQRDIKLIKTARTVYRMTRICSFGMIAVISSVILMDVLKNMK